MALSIDFFVREDFKVDVIPMDSHIAVRICRDFEERVGMFVASEAAAERIAAAFIEAANHFRQREEKGLVALDEAGLNEQAEESRLAALADEPSELERILHSVKKDGESFL